MLPIVGLYLAALLAIGWWCHRTRISGMTDFLLAGRRLGVVLCAAAMAATHFGGGALMGGASYGFQHGISGAWYGISTGVGLLLLLVLARAGNDLVTANAIKTLVILAITLIAVPVFIANDQVRWLPAFVLSAGTMTGGYLGANSAISGGERIIKPVLAVSVVILAGRMLGFY